MSLGHDLFSGWGTIWHTLVVGVPAYIVALVIVRLGGKRTLSKLNAYGFIITFALGSTLATIITSSTVSLAQGVVAFALLVGLQMMLTLLSSKLPVAGKLVKGSPRLLFYHGRMLHDAMRAERISEDAILAAVRSRGIARLSDVEAVVLETDGELSVVQGSGSGGDSSLRDVHGFYDDSPSSPPFP